MKSYDVVVIGGGSGGYSAARKAISLGAKVAVVEGGREVGGLCILRGCMPSKALLESSYRFNDIQHASEFGLKVKNSAPDPVAVLRRKDRLIEEFASYRRQELEEGSFDFIRGMGRFINPFELEITGKKKQRIRFKSAIIATGSEVAHVEVPGLKETGYLTSDEVIHLAKLPRRLIVLGGGSIAAEFAQHFRLMGCEVHMIQRSVHLLSQFEEEVAIAIEKVFVSQGIKVWTGTHLLNVSQTSKGKVVTFEQNGRKKRVEGDTILYALGRQPFVRTLGLEGIGLKLKKGGIPTNTWLQTPIRHIFAVGDVTNASEVVHLAVQQGEVAGRNAALLSKKQRKQWATWDDRLKALVVFTKPQVAVIGVTEKELKSKKRAYLSASYPFSDHGRAQIHGAKEGFVKILCDPRRGQILGAAIVGPHAGELIHELMAFMYLRGSVKQLAAMPHYHPTLAEIVTYPAEELVSKLRK